MGCWDIFCFLCGNPCHGMSTDAKEVFNEMITNYKPKNTEQ